MSILQYASPQARYYQADRDIRRGNTAATAQQVMTSPGQYYVAGRENFGSTPEVSLAGMSGFGSSAMGFQEGGMVPGLAFASSIRQALPAPIQQQGAMPQQAMVAQVMPYQQGGVGDLFRQQMQMQNMQFGSQMADLQGSPLKNYQNYLMNTYGRQAMENVNNSVQEDVNTFVDLVDQAERAHFGAEESFGYGGGQYHQNMMSQFQNMPQGLGQMPQGLGQMPQGLGQMPQALFSQGGAVDAITEEALAEMRQKVMNDYGIDFYRQYAPFAKETG